MRQTIVELEFNITLMYCKPPIYRHRLGHENCGSESGVAVNLRFPFLISHFFPIGLKILFNHSSMLEV
jgi:hypothetical protein